MNNNMKRAIAAIAITLTLVIITAAAGTYLYTEFRAYQHHRQVLRYQAWEACWGKVGSIWDASHATMPDGLTYEEQVAWRAANYEVRKAHILQVCGPWMNEPDTN